MLVSSTFASEWVFVQEYEGVKLFKLKEQKDGIIPFKATFDSTYEQEKFVQLLVDYQMKKDWSPKLKEVKLHKQLNKRSYVFSEYYSTPWPFYDREFLLTGEIIKNGDVVHFKASQFNDSSYADDSHVVANVQLLDVALKPIEKGTHIEFRFIGDMGGVIPSWVSNIIQKKWPVRFIQAMERTLSLNKQKVSKEYKDYLDDIQ